MTTIVATTLGTAVPAFTPHAISVSLPTWQDNVGYEEGEKRVVDAMVNGYPRFFIHRSIQKLSRVCEAKFGVNSEQCLLMPTVTTAKECRAFIIEQSSPASVNVRIAQFVIRPDDESSRSANDAELHIVLFAPDAFPVAKKFWTHTGMGISSRFADQCLSLLPAEPAPESPSLVSWTRLSGKTPNKHYSVKEKRLSPPSFPVDALTTDQNDYVEERYGRNLPQESAAFAKRALRRRIADVLVRDTPNDWDSAGSKDVEVGPSSRGIAEVSEDDVYLYPAGMCAIWHAHNLARLTRPSAKSVAFGFTYVDTLKILQKWGPGCHFFGHGSDEEVDQLEALLKTESKLSTSPPILALFTEFPSNPLLRSANLPRIRALADKYDFLIVVDESIGNFINVEVLPFADMVVSSLTKIFSGDANVMGGSLVLNPKGRHYHKLKNQLAKTYEDTYFGADAIYMERNSRDFKRRIQIIDENTEVLCDLLRSRSVVGGVETSAIKDILYPKWSSRENYDKCRVKGPDGSFTGGFGGLFSVTLTSAAASRDFFDALPINKGPSLGTNFTLASPYTILAHFEELEWAASYDVESGLVRVSVGMEDKERLFEIFEKGLLAAEAANKP